MSALENTPGKGAESYYTIVLRALSRNRAAQLGLSILSLLVVVSLVGPLVTPYDPTALNAAETMRPPSLRHPMGTDQFGRDILSRVMSGGRVSLSVGLLAVGIGASIGTLIGLFSGTLGGAYDAIAMRIMDLWFVFPPLLLALAVVALLGPGLLNTMLAVGIATIPSYARLVRGSVLSVKQSTYVLSARAIGCSIPRIAFRHVLPNVIAPIFILATFAVATSILTAAALSFLGLGAQPPQAEWGADLSGGRNYMRHAWWISTFPGLAIMLTTISINTVGDGLREALDPRFKAS